VIVASEERGEVSLVHHSTIRSMENVRALIGFLQSLDPMAPLISGRNFRHELLRYSQLKLLALGIASFLLLLMIMPWLFPPRDGTHHLTQPLSSLERGSSRELRGIRFPK